MVKYFCDFCSKEISNGEVEKEYARNYNPVYEGKRLKMDVSIKSDCKSFEHICSDCGFKIITWILCPKTKKPTLLAEPVAGEPK